MLDNYLEEQKIAYGILMNEIKNKKLSHAYLIDENNNVNAFDMIKAFVLEILGDGLEVNEKLILKKRIDDNNYPEFKIIEPDGMLIKKKQILDLQQDFSLSPVEGNKRIYVIRDADKMRSETANSMLKFLEEPNSDIIAILMTNNYNSMLSTIISRCQIIKLAINNKSEEEDIEIPMKFVESIENNGIKTLVDIQNLLFQNISNKERDNLILFFDKVIDIYYDIMKIEIKAKEIKYQKYYDVLEKFALKNEKENILKKINYLVMAKDMIKYNVNVNLLVDSVIVNLGGIK